MTQAAERLIDRTFVTRQHIIRRELLAVFYEARKQNRWPDMYCLIRTLGFDPDECRFALDYLLETARIRTTGVACQITATGIEYFEQELQ